MRWLKTIPCKCGNTFTATKENGHCPKCNTHYDVIEKAIKGRTYDKNEYVTEETDNNDSGT